MKKSITRRTFIKTSALTTAGFFVGCTINNYFDVIIKNGLILDGFGTPGMKKDIGIIGDTISILDNLAKASADLIIDAKEKTDEMGNLNVTRPGFRKRMREAFKRKR